MADIEDDLLPEGGEAEDAPVTDVEAEDNPEATYAEKIASELGWAPKKDWRGDEADWKPATDFLKTTIEVNKAQRKETRTLRDQLSRVERTTSAMIERVREQERENARKEHREAVEAGDEEAALEASRKLVAVTEAPMIPTETQEFISRNASWFDVDPIATAVARNIVAMQAQAGKSAAEQLEAAEKVISQRFPEYFDKPKPAVKPQAQVNDQQGRMARTPVSNRQKGYSDLPAAAKKAADDFLRKAGVPVEQYAAEYWKDNA